jgi:hypothetical protein
MVVLPTCAGCSRPCRHGGSRARVSERTHAPASACLGVYGGGTSPHNDAPYTRDADLVRRSRPTPRRSGDLRPTRTPPRSCGIAWGAQHRPHHTHTRLRARGKVPEGSRGGWRWVVPGTPQARRLQAHGQFASRVRWSPCALLPAAWVGSRKGRARFGRVRHWHAVPDDRERVAAHRADVRLAYALGAFRRLASQRSSISRSRANIAPPLGRPSSVLGSAKHHVRAPRRVPLALKDFGTIRVSRRPVGVRECSESAAAL